MEHRYTERKPVDLNAVISCPRVGLFRGRVLNLSLGGMYVESGCVVMPVDAPVTVSLQHDPEQPGTSLDVQGMVVHQRGNAFGLMFDDLEPGLHGNLRDLLVALAAPVAVSL